MDGRFPKHEPSSNQTSYTRAKTISDPKLENKDYASGKSDILDFVGPSKLYQGLSFYLFS